MPQQEEGLGHKLLSLLPIARHTTFRVKLTIHEVTNVPLLRGNFAVKWRFKNTVHGYGTSGDGSRASTPSSVAFSTPRDSNSNESGDNDKRYSRAEKGKDKQLDSPVDSIITDNPETPSNVSPPSPTKHAHSKYGQYLIPEPPPDTPPAARPSIDPTNPKESKDPSPVSSNGGGDATNTSQRKGLTSFVSIREHAVRWERVVETVVEMKIRKDTGELMPSELKLIIQEAYTPGVEVPQTTNGRLGVVILNLAEFADAKPNPIGRRFLLRESKSNATLKLTLEVTYLSGEKRFKAPPLLSGQAVAGVAGVLNSDHFRSFLPFDPRSSLLSLPGGSTVRGVPSRSPTPRATYPLPSFDADPSYPNIRRKSSSSASTSHRFLADPSLQSAEMVIEAIFNPFPSNSTTPSPFTYYSPAPTPTPPSDRPLDRESSDTESHVTGESLSPSSATSAPPDLHPRTTPGSGGWWRRFGGSYSSRPSTPPTTQPPQHALRKRRIGSGDSHHAIANSKEPVASKPASRANSHRSRHSTSSFVVVVETVS